MGGAVRLGDAPGRWPVDRQRPYPIQALIAAVEADELEAAAIRTEPSENSDIKKKNDLPARFRCSGFFYLNSKINLHECRSKLFLNYPAANLTGACVVPAPDGTAPASPIFQALRLTRQNASWLRLGVTTGIATAVATVADATAVREI